MKQMCRKSRGKFWYRYRKRLEKKDSTMICFLDECDFSGLVRRIKGSRRAESYTMSRGESVENALGLLPKLALLS